ncbi:hypothetical protein [Flavobacterium lipolyticum]|uniref:Uncharacterized protein n=1 Tax=Flavobacterium lipolyticum TaxID=2893754 RepID=A0ABS8M6I2_9FLAO|nr:hypothetical protein [Flavobacterium sp. F-126]MCC9020445.1 hypothetical protein [Flavobacterium sp. F-126]
MSKQLYPGLISHFFRKIITASQNQISIGSDVKKVEKNFNPLQEQMQRIGFPDLSEKLKMLIEKEHENFTLPLSYYINEKKKLITRFRFLKMLKDILSLKDTKSTCIIVLFQKKTNNIILKMSRDTISNCMKSIIYYPAARYIIMNHGSR